MFFDLWDYLWGRAMRERLLFIYNPSAGKAKLKAKLSDIVVEFSENGYEVIVMQIGRAHV